MDSLITLKVLTHLIGRKRNDMGILLSLYYSGWTEALSILVTCLSSDSLKAAVTKFESGSVASEPVLLTILLYDIQYSVWHVIKGEVGLSKEWPYDTSFVRKEALPMLGLSPTFAFGF